MNMPRAHVCDITQIGRRLYPFRWVNLLFSKFHVVLQISEELQKRFPSCSEELVEELANHLFRFVLQDSQRKCQLLLYVLCVSFFPFHGVKVPVLVLWYLVLFSQTSFFSDCEIETVTDIDQKGSF